MLEFRVLGPMRVSRHGDELHVGGPRQRRLLAALLVHRNEVVSTGRLLEAVFAGVPPPKAAETLRTYVMRLRRVVEEDGADPLLETRPPGYVLRAGDDAVDAARFERLVAEGRSCRDQGDPVGAASAFREALALWAGDPYPEFHDEDWVAAEARRLVELRAVIEEQLIDAELECGLAAELVPRLEVLVDRDPLRESYRARLMVALYRSGRQADALGVMRDYREALGRETGLDPSPELHELERRILAHEEGMKRVAPPTRVVRGYQLGERLGSGRDGAVHAARLPGVERDLAIRVVPPEIADRPDVVRSFDATMRRVASLHHDAIVPIDDHWREPGGAYVVFRRMRGGTLRDRLDRDGFGTEAVVDLARRVGSALEAAHGRGVVHGRVIPESVLFDDTGDAYLSDFPLGEVDGTPGDDVAAFGCLVLEAITGTRSVPTDLREHTAPAVDVLTSMLSADDPPTIAELLADLERAAAVSARAAPMVNPYKGLRAFDESDAADFFGREQLVDELVERLGGAGLGGRLLLVVGASGSGKSSVVRAGLLPRVRGDAIPGSGRWLVTTMVPGAAPFEELAESLGRVATAADPIGSSTRGLARELARGRGAIESALRRIVPEGVDVLLVIDQFEVLFTLADEDTQRTFLDAVMGALAAPDSRLRVVATLRADFYDRPLRFQGFGALVRDATITVPAMSAAQLEATIKGPADRVGLEVEPPLVAELVAAVVDQPAATPSLQFTLYELAERGDGRLDLAGYRQLGGLGGAIATRAETLYRSIGDAQDVVRQVFEQLVVIGPEGELTRRPTPRSELVGLAIGRSLSEVMDPWAQARLLTYDRHPETREPMVEVAHEALLREWPRLRGWIEADRAAIVAAGQLREAAASWASLDRDPDALYRGTKLEVTLDQLVGRTHTLPGTAREFLETSRTARDQRRENEAERIARQARTNRRLRRQLAALTVATIVAVAGGVLALDQRRQAQVEERVAAVRELAAASVSVVDEDPELAVLLALEAVDRTRVVGGVVLPEAEGALHRALARLRVVMRVPGLGGSVDWHPDGSVFVTEGPEGSGLVDLRDAETGEPVSTFTGHDADINDVAFSDDGSLLATSGDDGLVRVWDLDTGELQAELRGRGQVWGVSFSPDGSRVAAGWVEEGVVQVMDLTTDAPPLVVPAVTEPLASSTSFSPDGERLAIADIGAVVVVDVASGDRVLEFQTGTNQFTEEVLAVRWSPDGRWIASASRGLSTRVTDAETGERHLVLDGHTHDVHRLDWSVDGSRLATGARDGTARVWEITEGGAVEVVVVAAREGAIGGVAFSPDGERLLTGDVRVTAARIWDVGDDGGAEWANLPTASHVAGMAEFTPAGDAVIVTGVGVPAVVWDPSTGEPWLRLGADQGEAWEVDVSPDGDLVATIGLDEPPRVHVWDRHTGSEVFRVEEVGFYPERVAWSPDGGLLAAAGFRSDGPSGKITIVDRSGRRVTDLVEDAAHAPRNLAFDAGGERLVSQRRRLDRDDPTLAGVRVWDWARGEALVDLPVFADRLAVDPTGPRVAVAEVGAGGSVWDLETGERLATLSGHSGDISDVAFSPDGETIASSGADGTVRLWATETGAEQLVLDGRDGPVSAVAFAPDGDRLVSTGIGVARVWALNLDDLIGIAGRRLTRALTDDECRRYLHLEACPT